MSSYKGFNQVELRKPTRSTFNLSHEKRLSTRIGKLTPILITETMPNDTFHGSSEVLIKLAPLIAPIYHRLNLYVHYFFVPNRLLWDEWEDFITGGRLGETVTAPPVPPYGYINNALAAGQNYFDVGSLSDYLGIPPIPDSAVAAWTNVSTYILPHAAFYQCWYDYYRDRNYVPDNDILPLPTGLVGNPNATELLKTRYRCWEHDYFTSALPFTQRGSEVLMPLQGTGTVQYAAASEAYNADGTTPAPGAASFGSNQLQDAGLQPVRIENILNDEVNITNSEVSINDLRRAVRLQEWLERNALAGSRYSESIMAHFGRKTSDSRLQRAEYLGGGKAVVQISEVMTTAYSEDEGAAVIPPGTPSGRGSTYADTNRFSYNCEEHGFVVGILSVMPSSSYMQGLPRMFLARRTFLDYPWPSFAHLGEQEVYNYEIFHDTTTHTSNGQYSVFGYQSRYSEWKHIASSSHGDFRTTLDYWHLTRKFATLPLLGEQFVTFEDALQDRVFNVSGVDTLWLYVYNKLNVKRSLPYFGTPML